MNDQEKSKQLEQIIQSARRLGIELDHRQRRCIGWLLLLWRRGKMTFPLILKAVCLAIKLPCLILVLRN